MMKKLQLNLILALCFGLSCFILTTPARAATLSLEPTGSTLTVGNNYDLMVYVNASGDSVSAIDAIINYDSSYVTVQSITSSNILSSYPTKLFDGTKITISGNDGSGGTPYTGSRGLFATINFKVLKAGSTTFTFNFTSGSTTDSNVIGATPAVDVLTAVTNSTFMLSSGSNNNNNLNNLPKTALGDKESILGVVSGVIFILAGLIIFIAKRLERVTYK